jgi:hypothetical protein
MVSAESDRTRRPHTVNATVALIVAAIVANLAVWGLNLFVIPTPGFTQMRRQMGQQDALVGLAATATFWIIVSAVWLFLVFRMRAGRNGARLVLGVIGGLNGLVSVGGAAMDLFSSATDSVSDVLLGAVPDVLALGERPC